VIVCIDNQQVDERRDGARLAAHFTEDAICYDYIYGAHKGHADIA
jgi:hypothetical protein